MLRERPSSWEMIFFLAKSSSFPTSTEVPFDEQSILIPPASTEESFPTPIPDNLSPGDSSETAKESPTSKETTRKNPPGNTTASETEALMKVENLPPSSKVQPKKEFL